LCVGGATFVIATLLQTQGSEVCSSTPSVNWGMRQNRTASYWKTSSQSKHAFFFRLPPRSRWELRSSGLLRSE